jgi:hypothetical protein
MVVGLCFISGPAAWARKWTSSDGRSTVEAELVAVTDGKVSLKKPDGVKVTIPLDRLSAADRQFLAAGQVPATAGLRKWTSNDGRSAEAEFVSAADGKVTLRRAGGAVFTMPLERLSEADRTFIAGLQKNTAAPEAKKDDVPAKPQANNIAPQPAKTAVPASPPKKDISYVNDVRPILDKCCVACHKTKKARGGYKLETYADLVRFGKKGASVVPGNPAQSRIIVTHADGKPHPPKDKVEKDDKHVKAPPPTAAEMATLMEWIKAGAKDDSLQQAHSAGG